MAERRMFTKTIVESDAFLDMPLSTQALYFHFGMLADDDGFINSPKKIQKMIGAAEDDLRILLTKKFIIPFDTGIVVIKHWKMNNYIQKDRYRETVYQNEKSCLFLKKNNAYTLDESKGEPLCIQNVYKTDTQFSLGKVNKLNYTKLNIYYLYIIGKVENFEEVSPTERIAIIHILKDLDIFIKDPKTDDVIPENERRKLVYQYWAIKEIIESGDKVFIKNLTRDIFLNKFLKTCEHVDLQNETEFLNYFIKTLKNEIKEIEEKRIKK